MAKEHGSKFEIESELGFQLDPTNSQPAANKPLPYQKPVSKEVPPAAIPPKKVKPKITPASSEALPGILHRPCKGGIALGDLVRKKPDVADVADSIES